MLEVNVVLVVVEGGTDRVGRIFQHQQGRSLHRGEGHGVYSLGSLRGLRLLGVAAWEEHGVLERPFPCGVIISRSARLHVSMF